MESGMENAPAPEETLQSHDEENFGWEFHFWPLVIALGITVVLYGLIFLFVDPNPPYFDPAKLPPPPFGK